MRIEGSVTSLTWIPTDVFKGMLKLGMDLKLGHFDSTPPDRIMAMADLEELRDEDRLRMANRLSAGAEFVDGAPVKAEYTGGGVVGSTHAGVGRMGVTFSGVAMPELQRDPVYGADHVTFVQTVGGRTGVPMPRKVAHPPFVQWHAPIAWTTLSLTLFADGRAEWEVTGASPFPRHWIYGPDGDVVAKTGYIDTQEWMDHAFGDHTPWGDQDSPAIVTAMETAIENRLSHTLMADGKHARIQESPEGTVIASQGDPGTSLLVLLDGILAVDVDGEKVAEFGPGAVMGERAVIEQGTRTATLTALTPVRIAVADANDIDRSALEALSQVHRKEEQPA